MQILRRFWFEFDFSEEQRSYGWSYLPAYGCGITAYDLDDAFKIMRVFLLRQPGWPKLRRVIVNVDVAKLDQSNVQRYMGVPVWRGMWYPRNNLYYGPYTE